MKLVSVETPEKSVCKMTFSATAEELEAASNAVYERTRANYTIKGFEKGEADRAQIEADRGEHTFWYDAINDLMDKDVPALYDAALAEHGFHPVDEPSYDLVSVKKDEGFVATATVALQPELNLTQTTGFVVECVTPAVTDKEIDAVLERRRNAAAELVPHKGPAVKGNVVHMDFEGLLDGVAFQGGTAQNQSVQLGSGRMIPGFEDGILGHKAGDEFDIHVTFPERYHAKDLAGKAVVFKIKLHDVCVRQLPSMNSDFAKKVGGVDTMEEFREKVRKQLYDGRHGGALNRAKDQVLAKLADAAEGVLPSVLVESTYQQEMQNVQQQLQMQRMTLNSYLSQIHETRESFTAKLHAGAEKNTRARMALLQIAQQENLVPTDEEIDKMIAERAERTEKDRGGDPRKDQHPRSEAHRGHPPRCRLGDRALHHRGKVTPSKNQNRLCRCTGGFFRSPKFSLYARSLKPMMTMPSTTSTTPVARFRVLGAALLANTAAMRAHSRVNTTHSTQTPQSGAPPIMKWETAPVRAVKVMMNTLVPTAVLSS